MAHSVFVRVLYWKCVWAIQACTDVHISMVLDCIGNTCVCKNGVGEVGVGCPAIGAEKCASCKAGFTINHARTKCTRTCVEFEEYLANV